MTFSPPPDWPAMVTLFGRRQIAQYYHVPISEAIKSKMLKLADFAYFSPQPKIKKARMLSGGLL